MKPVEQCREQIRLARLKREADPLWYSAIWEADYQAEHFILTGELYEPPVDWRAQHES